MSGPRHKVAIKWDCGQAVGAGSVFCPHCKAEVSRKNAKTIKKEEKKYQQEVRGKKRRRK